MKKSLRFASAALALTLAAGCAMPAFAAGKSSFSKSETVYAVMNGDGSIKSTTVSEHLYSASGLANVTDKTTLTDIQNTESDAEFTQNGEELVWNTNDTDVYYKGNTDKALPIDVKVTYALDGHCVCNLKNAIHNLNSFVVINQTSVVLAFFLRLQR